MNLLYVMMKRKGDHMRKSKKALMLGFGLMAAISLSGCSSSEKKEEETSVVQATARSQESIAQKEEKEEKAGTATLKVNADTSVLDESNDISEILYGLFLEDINYAVDGGLYAEKIKNRSFEYGGIATNGNKHGWTVTNSDTLTFDVVDGSKDKTYLNENNPQYARITNTGDTQAGIYNGGYLDGLAIEENATYRFTGYFRGVDGYKGPVKVMFATGGGETVYGEGEIKEITDEWWKYEVEITTNATMDNGVKFFVCIDKGTVEMDMISVFPVDTYNGRENGLRKELVEYLADLNPSFLRFPGGCLIEGKTIETAYSWKDSIGNGMEFEINGEKTVGDVATRPLGTDIWADFNNASSHPYYMTYGVGFYEYFLLCEDLDCLPVPILNAGMSCPIQSPNYTVIGTDTEEFQQYIQDALDLVEFCRGDKNTKWGAVRIAMGHEEPFELKYVGIGNEQWQTEYYQHFAKFKEAFAKAAEENPEMYGDIELIVANGPNSGDTFAWDRINLLGEGASYAGLVDEHYYQTPAWFLSNVDRYDSYDRDSVPVFLGEYAAKSNNMEAALAEAAYMTGLEENADIVKLACYAPLFGNETATQWAPDMIWFSNNDVYGSANYYVQKLFANNLGTKTLNTELTVEDTSEGLSGKVGLGTWCTSAEFDNVKVVDNETQEVLYSDEFKKDSFAKYEKKGGNFVVEDGVFKQKSTGSPANENTGDVVYFGEKDWSNYTYTLTAKKTGGDEGFLIPIAVQDEDNSIFWNIGGWGNTVSCLQIVSNGSKSDQVEGTVRDISLQSNVEYQLKVVVEDTKITCYMGMTKVIEYEYQGTDGVYQTTSIDENNDIIIKLVNVTGKQMDTNIQIENAATINTTAEVSQIKADKASLFNSKTVPDLIKIEESQETVSENFTYSLPKYSVTIMRIHQS